MLAERSQLTAQGLAVVLWSLVRLKLQPGRRWLHTLLAPHTPISKDKPGHRGTAGGHSGGDGDDVEGEPGTEHKPGRANSADIWQGAGLRVLAMCLWALPRLGVMAQPSRNAARSRSPQARALLQQQQQQQQQQGTMLPLEGQQQFQAQVQGGMAPLQVQRMVRAQQQLQQDAQAEAEQRQVSLSADRLQNDLALLRPLLDALQAQLQSEVLAVRKLRRRQRQQQQQQQVMSSHGTSENKRPGGVNTPDSSSSSSSTAAGPASIGTHAPAALPASVEELIHAVAVAVRALGRLNSCGRLAPLLSRDLFCALDDACVLLMPRFGGVALSAVVGGLPKLGHRPSASLTAAVVRRVGALVQPLQTSVDVPSSSSSRSSSSQTRVRAAFDGTPAAGVGKAWGGAAGPRDFLTSWQLAAVLHGMACMRCPVTKPWLLGMMQAWWAMQGRLEEGGALRVGVAEEEDELESDWGSELLDAHEGGSATKCSSWELLALRQVARIYNVRMPVVPETHAKISVSGS